MKTKIGTTKFFTRILFHFFDMILFKKNTKCQTTKVLKTYEVSKTKWVFHFLKCLIFFTTICILFLILFRNSATFVFIYFCFLKIRVISFQDRKLSKIAKNAKCLTQFIKNGTKIGSPDLHFFKLIYIAYQLNFRKYFL